MISARSYAGLAVGFAAVSFAERHRAENKALAAPTNGARDERDFSTMNEITHRECSSNAASLCLKQNGVVFIPNVLSTEQKEACLTRLADCRARTPSLGTPKATED